MRQHQIDDDLGDDDAHAHNHVDHDVYTLAVTGGVACNEQLRRTLARVCEQRGDAARRARENLQYTRLARKLANSLRRRRHLRGPGDSHRPSSDGGLDGATAPPTGTPAPPTGTPTGTPAVAGDVDSATPSEEVVARSRGTSNSRRRHVDDDDGIGPIPQHYFPSHPRRWKLALAAKNRCSDNGLMIAWAAVEKLLQRGGHPPVSLLD
eukprot:GHVU01193624.1.p1 GENE.GHVU01193624.1~~GHVU01193624.1.p1  ORF type:complete len:208 (+),score=37.54 GHVU01193624.1:43-666(+)